MLSLFALVLQRSWEGIGFEALRIFIERGRGGVGRWVCHLLLKLEKVYFFSLHLSKWPSPFQHCCSLSSVTDTQSPLGYHLLSIPDFQAADRHWSKSRSVFWDVSRSTSYSHKLTYNMHMHLCLCSWFLCALAFTVCT